MMLRKQVNSTDKQNLKIKHTSAYHVKLVYCISCLGNANRCPQGNG